MHRYSFNVFWSEPDAAYFAISPEFPGVSASGDTPEAALAEAQISMRLMIALYNEEGWVLPDPHTGGPPPAFQAGTVPSGKKEC